MARQDIAKLSVNDSTGNCIILTDDVDKMLNTIGVELDDKRISYVRARNSIVYTKKIDVYKVTLSTWGIHIDDDVEALIIDNADTIHPKILERLSLNQPCRVILMKST